MKATISSSVRIRKLAKLKEEEEEVEEEEEEEEEEDAYKDETGNMRGKFER